MEHLALHPRMGPAQSVALQNCQLLLIYTSIAAICYSALCDTATSPGPLTSTGKTKLLKDTNFIRGPSGKGKHLIPIIVSSLLIWATRPRNRVAVSISPEFQGEIKDTQ